MNAVTFAAYVRRQTRTTATTLPDATLLLYMNKVKDTIANMIVERDEDYFVTPQTANLVANQREYPLPQDILNRIERVEAKLDGTNFIKLEVLDQSQYSEVSDETTIINSFSNGKGGAFYDIIRSSIYLYSGTITSVTNGLKIWANAYPPDISSLASTEPLSVDPTTTTHGIPRGVHDIWAEGVIIEWKNGQQKPIPLTRQEQLWEARVEATINRITPVSSEEAIIASVPDFPGNSGYDY